MTRKLVIDAAKISYHAHNCELAAMRLRTDNRPGLASGASNAAEFLRALVPEIEGGALTKQPAAQEPSAAGVGNDEWAVADTTGIRHLRMRLEGALTKRREEGDTESVSWLTAGVEALHQALIYAAERDRERRGRLIDEARYEPWRQECKRLEKELRKATATLTPAAPKTPDAATGGSVGDGGLREPITDHGEAGVSIALRVVQRVCDFDDRTSPEDQPDMMLVTGQELTDLIEEEVSRYWPEPALAQPAPLGDAATLRAALAGLADDYMTSEKHHPGYVLIPTAKFEELRALGSDPVGEDETGVREALFDATPNIGNGPELSLRGIVRRHFTMSHGISDSAVRTAAYFAALALTTAPTTKA